MKDGFIKVATVTPKITVADCKSNAQAINELVNKTYNEGVNLVVFPELCVSAYTCGDLFFQPTLQNGVKDALSLILKESKNKEILIFVGAPLKKDNKLYNCAVAIYNGEILGVVPKTNIPNYNEFSETRYFESAEDENSEIELLGETVPFGTKLLFVNKEMEEFCVSAEICEDMFSVFAPSLSHAANGALVVANLSASNELVGKSEFRLETVKNLSSRLICAYLYANAGDGESTGDLVFSGHNIICENGTVLCESAPFEGGYCVTEIDLQKLAFERSKINTFPKNQNTYTKVFFSMTQKKTKLSRKVSKTPFIPSENLRNPRFESILKMQSHALKQRLCVARAKTAVIGISGGLDSALALLVTTRAIDLLNRPRTDIVAISMPCFGTTARTKTNAQIVCEGLGVTFFEINITNSVKSHLNDISHSIDCHDVTFENAQARERTQVLMDVANKMGGLVIGTGDLSELALGWATYNGDHMSMYGVNCDIPKTLVRHLVRFEAENCKSEPLKNALLDILDTPVSPELIPAKNGEITQKTEDLVGPYELHDFFIYNALRYGFSPKKVYRLANYAFENDYDGETIKKWLKTFYHRFFTQQFKRSCVPDGVKVGSVAFSPRGDLKMPSDASNALWLNELEEI